MESKRERLKDWVRPEVRGLQPYVPEAMGPRIRLDANESPFDMPAELKQAVWENYSHQTWNRYPDPDCLSLRRAIAEYEDVNPEQIILGNGSDEILRDLLICYGGPRTKTVFPTPTFSMYRLLTIALGGTPVGVRLQADWSLDLEAFIQAVTGENCRVTFIANPNNPTGCTYPTEQIEEIIQRAEGLVVVDEAYRLFANTTLVPFLKKYPNLIVLSTYSKSMSAAGLRIGYLIGDAQVVETLNRVRLPYNLDSFAQQVALTAIQRMDHWRANAQVIVQERERLSSELAQIEGVTVFPSQANFILVQLSDAEMVKLALAERDIAVRGFNKTEGLTKCLRITVGTPLENSELCKQFKSILMNRRG